MMDTEDRLDERGQEGVGGAGEGRSVTNDGEGQSHSTAERI